MIEAQGLEGLTDYFPPSSAEELVKGDGPMDMSAEKSKIYVCVLF